MIVSWMGTKRASLKGSVIPRQGWGEVHFIIYNLCSEKKKKEYPEKSLHVTLNTLSLYRVQLNIGKRRFTNECFLFLFTFFTATTQQRSGWLIFWPTSLCQMMKFIQLFQDRPVEGSTSTHHTRHIHMNPMTSLLNIYSWSLTGHMLLYHMQTSPVSEQQSE